MELMSFVSEPQVLVSLAALIILLWRMSYGYKNGFVSELFTIAALALGFVAVLMSAEALNKLLNGGNLHIVSTVIKIAIIVAVYRVIQGISKGMKGIKNIPIVGSANKILGAAFGFVETYVWLYVLNYIIGYDFAGAIKYTIAGITSMIKA